MKKKLVSYIVITAILLTNIFSTYAAILPMTLYEEVEGNYIAKGVYLQEISRFTDAGWVDLDVVKVDLEEETIDLELLGSDQTGDKEPLSVLTDQANESNEDEAVVAGINGDYFATNKVLTVALGPTILEGQLMNAYDKDHPIEAGQYMLLQDQMGAIAFQSPQLHFGFMNQKGDWMEITAMNKVTSVYKPSYFDRKAMVDTSSLDELNDFLYKIVVEEDKIQEIIKDGSTIEIPETGYIITMNNEYAMQYIDKFEVGQKVSFNMETNFTIEDIQLGFAGGGMILKDGQAVEEPGLIVDKKKRHPRSVVGTGSDGKQLIMVTIDGRGRSIGATLEETVAYLKELGVQDAIMLDGGGSTTMVARPSGEEATEVINDPSGAFERPVINGLGISTSAEETSEIGGLHIAMSAERVFLNNEANFQLTGYDTNYNPMTIDTKDVTWQAEGVSGFWVGSSFKPVSTGTAIITASYKGVVQTTQLIVMEPATITADTLILHLAKGEEKELMVKGLDELGYSGPIDASSLIWSIAGNLGYVKGGKLVAGDQTGVGKLTGKLGDVTVSFVVTIGTKQAVLDGFDQQIMNVEPIVYPDVVEATIEEVKGKTDKALALNYSFIGDTEATQGAYISFIEPVAIEGRPTKLGLNVKGDGSANWLRGRIIDAKGETHTITFANQVDWTGWKYVEASLPDGLAYPIALKRVYVVSLAQEEALQSSIIIDDLSAHYPLIDEEVTIQGPALKDKQYIDYEEFSILEGDKIGIFGTTAGKNTLLDRVIERDAIKQLNNLVDLALFTGDTEITEEAMIIPYTQWQDEYQIVDYGNLSVINVGTTQGGIASTDPEQWIKLQEQLKKTTAKHIIITMDKNPLEGFSDKSEGELLHQVLSDFASETGKDIYVINASGYDTSHTLYEGVRYIDLNGLWYQAEGEKLDLQNSFYMLLFNVGNEGLSYTIKPIYE